jgi:hypothetical protein
MTCAKQNTTKGVLHSEHAKNSKEGCFIPLNFNGRVGVAGVDNILLV